MACTARSCFAPRSLELDLLLSFSSLKGNDKATPLFHQGFLIGHITQSSTVEGRLPSFRHVMTPGRGTLRFDQRPFGLASSTRFGRIKTFPGFLRSNGLRPFSAGVGFAVGAIS